VGPMLRFLRAASQFTLDLTGKTSFCASIVATSERHETAFEVRNHPFVVVSTFRGEFKAV